MQHVLRGATKAEASTCMCWTRAFESRTANSVAERSHCTMPTSRPRRSVMAAMQHVLRMIGGMAPTLQDPLVALLMVWPPRPRFGPCREDAAFPTAMAALTG